MSGHRYVDAHGRFSPRFLFFSVSILLAISVIFGVSVQLVVNSLDRNYPPDPFRRRELTAQYAFEGYAENLRLMAAMKEKCGHLFEPVQWVGCTNLPPSWQDTRNLDHLSDVGSSLSVWLNEVSPVVDTECEDEAPCRQWLEEKKRKENEPPLNITFEEVDLSQ